MTRRAVLSMVWGVGILLGIALVPVSSFRGENYQISQVRMPLVIKLADFLLRDYQLRTLTARLTRGVAGDEAKALALLQWTHEHVRPIPPGFSIVDDHITNILIRGYGTRDQAADVYTTLCQYAGIPAVMYLAKPRDRNTRLILAAVRLHRSWRLVDVARDFYFRNAQGAMASLEELLQRPQYFQQAASQPPTAGIPYARFFEALVPIPSVATTRAQLQMPLARIGYEVERALHLVPEVTLFYGRQ